MPRHLIALCTPLPAFALAATSPVAAAEITISATGPVVELGISESVEARPDIADISAGVTSEAMSATEAMQANARAMNAVIERIKALGIAERDIQTTGINLNPRYDYEQQERRQVFRGYQVSNRVRVTLRDIERAGSVLDALVAAGATDLSGPNWSIADPAPARAQARERAMQTARERALEYARLAGYSDARLLEVREAVPFDRPMPMARMMAMDVAEAATPVEPGRVEAGVTITISYELIG